MKRLRYLLLVVLAGYLLTGVAQVRPEERAVVRRFGKVVAHPGPGLWVGFPYGIDRIDRVPTATVRRVPVGYRPEPADDIPSASSSRGTKTWSMCRLRLIMPWARDPVIWKTTSHKRIGWTRFWRAKRKRRSANGFPVGQLMRFC